MGKSEGHRQGRGRPQEECGHVHVCTMGSSLPPVTEAARGHWHGQSRDDGRWNDGCTEGSRDPFDDDIGIVMPVVRGVFAVALHCR